MVDIKKQNNVIKINVTSSTEDGKITPANDASAYYSSLAKAWANKTNDPVDGTEYSSKYYAELAKEASQTAYSAKSSVLNNSGFQTVAADLTGDNNIGLCAQNISVIQNAVYNAQLAAEKAVIATEQAEIATEQAAAVSTTLSGALNKNLTNITDAGKDIIKTIVDTAGISANLAGKVNTDLSNCTKPYLVETYQNENSWYRVYSDGFCIQGGAYWSSQYDNLNGTSARIQLLKTLKDIKTGVTAQISQMNEIAAGYHTGFRIAVETTSTVTVAWLTSGSPRLSWLVTGYIEDGESSNSD